MSHSAIALSGAQVFVGLDVHKETIRLAALHQRHFVFEQTIPTKNLDSLRKAVFKLAKRYGTVSCCYEAGGAGFRLQRLMSEWGIACVVIAPSLMPVRPGDRRKTDEYDARKLAEFHSNGQLTSVRVPTAEEESVSDLVRCRMAVKKEQVRARNRVVKFLNRKDVRCDVKAWTKEHITWLAELNLPNTADQLTLGFYLEHLEHVSQQLGKVDAAVLEISESEPYRESVALLRGFHSVQTLTAMVLLTQIGEIERFSSSRKVMSYVGLTPSMNMSGSSKNGSGSITKTGNSVCRHVLIQAAWNHVKSPRPEKSRRCLQKQEGLPGWAIEMADKARLRIHKRIHHLTDSRRRNVAIVAGARELIGFLSAALFRQALEKRARSTTAQQDLERLTEITSLPPGPLNPPEGELPCRRF